MGLNLLDLPMRKTQFESDEVTKVTKPLQVRLASALGWPAAQQEVLTHTGGKYALCTVEAVSQGRFFSPYHIQRGKRIANGVPFLRRPSVIFLQFV